VNAQEVISDLKRQEMEILTEARLTETIESAPRPTTYIGVEPSAALHIGFLASALPVVKLTKWGFRGIILLADLHALANDKGELKEIEEIGKKDRTMFEKIMSRLGLAGKIEYKFGTEFEDQSYFIQMLRLAKHVNFTEAQKSMDQISRSSVARMLSSAIYPLMQAMDIAVMGVNVAVGGIDQRKVHVLAIENLRKLGYSTPVAIHTQMLAGTDGKNMMHKSYRNTIDLEETSETLGAKIKKTFCPPREVENNPILDWYRKLIFPLSDGPIAFADREASSYSELERYWLKDMVSPQELKKAAERDIGNLIL
jgi:tyrosyl-tRNA synthetase